MTRARSLSRNKLVETAMRLFWERGYNATSIDDLVRATEVGRGGIYADFGGKEALFSACLQTYRAQFADPAIALLYAGQNGKDGDGLAAIEAFFDHFIALHEWRGLPSPGCFIANTMTEVAPHDRASFDLVQQHSADLHAAFAAALRRVGSAGTRGALDDDGRDQLAQFLVTASQGLWSYARSVDDIVVLKQFKAVLIDLLRARLVCD